MEVEVGGLCGLIILVLDIWAIVNIVQSGKIVLMLLLAVLGLIIWFFFGRGD